MEIQSSAPSSSDKPVVDITTRLYNSLNKQRSKPQTLLYKAVRFVEYRKSSRELLQPARYRTNVIQDHSTDQQEDPALLPRGHVLVLNGRPSSDRKDMNNINGIPAQSGNILYTSA